MKFDAGIPKNEEKVIFELRSLYHKYGYAQYKMSKFEEYDLYVKNKDFLISEDVITFTDTNGRLMALKPDVTLSIVRNSNPAENQVQKVYYNENVYRVSKGSRVFKEIMQVGLECIGAVDDYCIGEVLVLAAQSLKLISEESILNISHLGIINSMLDGMQLSEGAKQKILRCIGEKNLHEISAICMENSADAEDTERLKDLVLTYGQPEKVLPHLKELGCNENALQQLKLLTDMLSGNGLGKHICIDFSVLSDMKYYNGIAFKGFVRGVPTSVISGGQYDKLLKRMGKTGHAVGFAAYLDLLQRLDRSDRRYDIDTVLLYDENTDPMRLNTAVRQLLSGGISVMAQKAVPEKIKYRQLAKLTESGVTILEVDA